MVSLQALYRKLGKLGATVVNDRAINRPQNPVRDIGRTRDLEEVAATFTEVIFAHNGRPKAIPGADESGNAKSEPVALYKVPPVCGSFSEGEKRVWSTRRVNPTRRRDSMGNGELLTTPDHHPHKSAKYRGDGPEHENYAPGKASTDPAHPRRSRYIRRLFATLAAEYRRKNAQDHGGNGKHEPEHRKTLIYLPPTRKRLPRSVSSLWTTSFDTPS